MSGYRIAPVEPVPDRTPPIVHEVLDSLWAHPGEASARDVDSLGTLDLGTLRHLRDVLAGLGRLVDWEVDR